MPSHLQEIWRKQGRTKGREEESDMQTERRESRQRERAGIDRPTEIQRESETREAMCVLVSNHKHFVLLRMSLLAQIYQKYTFSLSLKILSFSLYPPSLPPWIHSSPLHLVHAADRQHKRLLAMPYERAQHSNISKAVPTLKKQQHSVISTRTVLCILGRVGWEKSQFCHQVVTHIFLFSHLPPLYSSTTLSTKKQNCVQVLLLAY